MADKFPVIDVNQQCGAKGDGISDDTPAFQMAAKAIQEAGGGTLLLPRGVYSVGDQRHVAGGAPYFSHRDIFAVHGLKFLRIVGNGATLRLKPGMRYGSFDPETGQPLSPTLPFYDVKSIAAVGNMFSISHSRRVTIEDLILDGNSDSLLLGGPWGDTGRQLPGTGVSLYNNTDVRIRGVQSHHHALDGIIIGYTGLKATDSPTPHTLTNCIFEYNGRQGLSWVGGIGLTARRCRFNRTGRGNLQSAPGAGLDIEAEDSVCRAGLFEDCEFLDNTGCGMVASSGDGGYTRFVRCLFHGSTTWSVWSAKPGLVYEKCVFHGSAVHTLGSPDPTLATQFRKCRFEDKSLPGVGPVYRNNYLVETDQGGQNVTFDTCTFIANQVRSLWFGGYSGRGRFNGCTFEHRNARLFTNDFQAVIRNADLLNCHFVERFPAGFPRQYVLLTEKSRVLPGPATTVDGPCVTWHGKIGPITPGNY